MIYADRLQRYAGFANVPRRARRMVVAVPFLEVLSANLPVLQYVVYYHTSTLVRNGFQEFADLCGEHRPLRLPQGSTAREL